jgi:prevent-host-death family protein
MFAETITLSKAKAHFSELLKRIKDHHESFAITQRGKIEGVLMSYEEYESLTETLEILSDRDLMDSIQKGLSEEKRGKLHSHNDVFED